MKALLLAAGVGSRLRPITDTIPKCLVELGGRPLIDYWLDMLVPSGICPLLINLHYLADEMRSHLKRSPYADQISTVFEEELLGTGGTLLANRNWFDNESFMLLHADNLSLFDVGRFIARHRKRPAGCLVTMLVFETESPESCGIVVRDEQGIVREFHEKTTNPPGNLASGATFILEPEIFEYLEATGHREIDFSKEILPQLIGRIQTFEEVSYHRDIGTLPSLERARRDVAAGALAQLKI